jgi:hypothetical protein
MAPHVDLVENRWSGGYQERVGTASAEGGQIEVSASDPYAHLVREALGEMEGSSAEQALVELGHRFRSDYFFATDLHDDDECPFAHGEQVPFAEVKVAHPAGT